MALSSTPEPVGALLSPRWPQLLEYVCHRIIRFLCPKFKSHLCPLKTFGKSPVFSESLYAQPDKDK